MVNNFDIQEYLADGVEYIIKDAIRASIRNPKEILYLRKFSKYAKKPLKSDRIMIKMVRTFQFF